MLLLLMTFANRRFYEQFPLNFLISFVGYFLSQMSHLDSLRESIAEKDARKVNAIAQDLVYVSSKG